MNYSVAYRSSRPRLTPGFVGGRRWSDGEVSVKTQMREPNGMPYIILGVPLSDW